MYCTSCKQWKRRGSWRGIICRNCYGIEYNKKNELLGIVTNKKRKEYPQLTLPEKKKRKRELINNWEYVTDTKLTPKCHLLLHISSFIKEYKYIGKYNESSLESYHANFRNKEINNHFNKGENKCEKLRSVLADQTLISIQPFI